MRENLNRELVAVTQELLRLHARAHSSRRACQNDRARAERRALREKADDLGNIEDQVAAGSKSVTCFHIHR